MASPATAFISGPSGARTPRSSDSSRSPHAPAESERQNTRKSGERSPNGPQAVERATKIAVPTRTREAVNRLCDQLDGDEYHEPLRLVVNRRLKLNLTEREFCDIRNDETRFRGRLNAAWSTGVHNVLALVHETRRTAHDDFPPRAA